MFVSFFSKLANWQTANIFYQLIFYLPFRLEKNVPEICTNEFQTENHYQILCIRAASDFHQEMS
jgi:hypothetical protein